MSRRRNRGFSLLEAIVALVLVASTGVAVFSWINVNLITLNRSRAQAVAATATRNALEVMRSVNPGEQPAGSVEIDGWTYEWNATELQPMVNGAGYPGGMSLFDVGLFDTRVRVLHEGSAVADFQLRQPGYKQAREWNPPL